MNLQDHEYNDNVRQRLLPLSLFPVPLILDPERSLWCARTEEQGRVPGGTTKCGGTREADQEHPFPSDEIGDAASEQKQPTEGQRVCGDDPLSVRIRDMQTDLSVWQGDVHDGSVEHDHQ